jgi:hypothetical protein
MSQDRPLCRQSQVFEPQIPLCHVPQKLARQYSNIAEATWRAADCYLFLREPSAPEPELGAFPLLPVLSVAHKFAEQATLVLDRDLTAVRAKNGLEDVLYDGKRYLNAFTALEAFVAQIKRRVERFVKRHSSLSQTERLYRKLVNRPTSCAEFAKPELEDEAIVEGRLDELRADFRELSLADPAGILLEARKEVMLLAFETREEIDLLVIDAEERAAARERAADPCLVVEGRPSDGATPPPTVESDSLTPHAKSPARQGAVKAGVFVWPGGTCRKLTMPEWKLLDALCDGPRLRDPVPEAEVITKVYGEMARNKEGALRALCLRTQKKLDSARIRLMINRPETPEKHLVLLPIQAAHENVR